MTHAFFTPPDGRAYALRNARAPRCLIDGTEAGTLAPAGDGDHVGDRDAGAVELNGHDRSSPLKRSSRSSASTA